MQEICPRNPGLEETAQRNLNLGPREFDRGGVVSETPVKTRPAAEMRSGSVQKSIVDKMLPAEYIELREWFRKSR